jgi:hypothetical protein
LPRAAGSEENERKEGQWHGDGGNKAAIVPEPRTGPIGDSFPPVRRPESLALSDRSATRAAGCRSRQGQPPPGGGGGHVDSLNYRPICPRGRRRAVLFSRRLSTSPRRPPPSPAVSPPSHRHRPPSTMHAPHPGHNALPHPGLFDGIGYGDNG